MRNLFETVKSSVAIPAGRLKNTGYSLPVSEATPPVIHLITQALETAFLAGVHPQDLWVGPDEEKEITTIANEWPSLGGKIKTLVGSKFAGLNVRRMDIAGVAIR